MADSEGNGEATFLDPFWSFVTNDYDDTISEEGSKSIAQGRPRRYNNDGTIMDYLAPLESDFRDLVQEDILGAHDVDSSIPLWNCASLADKLESESECRQDQKRRPRLFGLKKKSKKFNQTKSKSEIEPEVQKNSQATVQLPNKTQSQGRLSMAASGLLGDLDPKWDAVFATKFPTNSSNSSSEKLLSFCKNKEAKKNRGITPESRNTIPYTDRSAPTNSTHDTDGDEYTNYTTDNDNEIFPNLFDEFAKTFDPFSDVESFSLSDLEASDYSDASTVSESVRSSRLMETQEVRLAFDPNNSELIKKPKKLTNGRANEKSGLSIASSQNGSLGARSSHKSIPDDRNDPVSEERGIEFQDKPKSQLIDEQNDKDEVRQERNFKIENEDFDEYNTRIMELSSPISPSIFSFDETIDSKSTGHSYKSVNKLACWRAKNYRNIATQKTIHQLDATELAANFPKIRIVPDQNPASNNHQLGVASGSGFSQSIPAHLQVPFDAFLQANGPHSLYEYEYDITAHADVVCDNFGLDPRSLIKVRRHLPMLKPNKNAEEVIIQVEASTISLTDCAMRRGDWWENDFPSLPFVPGTNIVGKVFQSSREICARYNLSLGDRVISLTKCGGNARFISMHPNQVVKISDDVDPAAAACLAETYLSAFQVLHIGQNSRNRYRRNSLKGKAILILGSMNGDLGHAIIQTASVGGAGPIYATSKPKHFKILQSLGAIPLSVGPMIWIDKLRGQIDLVISTGGDQSEDVIPLHFKALSDKGHMIIVGRQAKVCGVSIADWDVKTQPQQRIVLCKKSGNEKTVIDRTHAFDLFRNWDYELHHCKKDLSHLAGLLEKEEIQPMVLDRVSLSKVAKAQELVEANRYQGSFVCEPWLKMKKRAVAL